MSTVLVTGATGFVGRRLVPGLVQAGHEVRAMTRRPFDYAGPADPVFGDVAEPTSLREALDGCEIAFYLVHSLDDHDFERKDADAARAFGAAAARAGVRQIVYLGGLGAEDEELSPHLRSRREVETLLGQAGVPVTVLRAAIVVGDGGISWEMTRQLVHHLPAMVVPKWAATRTQPIAIDDVVRYLVGVAGHADAFDRVFEIGGADQLSYLGMLQEAAQVMRGRRLPIMQLPIGTPLLSAYWIKLITGVDVVTAGNLIESMRTEVVQRDHAIREVVPGEPLTYAEAVRRAIAEADAVPA
ncbi:NAD(P)H-binding protein [Nocardioides sp. TRM66260-LWL]|uniref:NAD(P)H-binding protein n=1 Tax=Nocardioides sp. TRM66260-LWL TaxID=2874478 RepID=UPI001CC72295|nr:NAD(P)H-binding protein [Nocardioides sp. TRM66260-LWL]MBZ5736019.1 NAD(P)H-binding protein [Nocardioides sp. TRM66260-LWL]